MNLVQVAEKTFAQIPTLFSICETGQKTRKSKQNSALCREYTGELVQNLGKLPINIYMQF